LKAAVEFGQLALLSNWDLSISVATGELLFTKLGNAHRSDASLLGDVVNLSARLLGIHHEASRVLCDEATYSATRTHFLHVDIGLHKLKGKPEPVRVRAVQPLMMNAMSRKKGLFGYKDERARLRQAVELWSQGSKGDRIFFVEGKSGMGKSTILWELMDYVHEAKLSHW
jgi:hypothetical protein